MVYDENNSILMMKVLCKNNRQIDMVRVASNTLSPFNKGLAT